MAVFSIQLTGSHTEPASREARCRAAVALRPSCMPPSSSAPKGRGVGSRGAAPCASHEARCRMAVFSIQLAGSHTEPASREARCRAAVALRPSCMPPSSSAPKGRGVGSRGAAPCASHEARCRMAVYAMQAAGSRTRPASREARCRAAVALRLTSMSPEHPARHRRAVRG